MAACAAAAPLPPQPGPLAAARPAGSQVGLGRLVVDRQLGSPRSLRLPGARLACVSRVRIYLAAEPAPVPGGAGDAGGGAAPITSGARGTSDEAAPVTSGAAGPCEVGAALADEAASGACTAGAARGRSADTEEQQQVRPVLGRPVVGHLLRPWGELRPDSSRGLFGVLGHGPPIASLRNHVPAASCPAHLHTCPLTLIAFARWSAFGHAYPAEAQDEAGASAKAADALGGELSVAQPPLAAHAAAPALPAPSAVPASERAPAPSRVPAPAAEAALAPVPTSSAPAQEPAVAVGAAPAPVPVGLLPLEPVQCGGGRASLVPVSAVPGCAG